MAVDFTKGFWLSIYADRFAGAAPPLEMRVMVGGAAPPAPCCRTTAQLRRPPGKFALKLLTTWAAMGFRRAPLPAYPAITLD